MLKLRGDGQLTAVPGALAKAFRTHVGHDLDQGVGLAGWAGHDHRTSVICIDIPRWHNRIMGWLLV